MKKEKVCKNTQYNAYIGENVNFFSTFQRQIAFKKKKKPFAKKRPKSLLVTAGSRSPKSSERIQ